MMRPGSSPQGKPFAQFPGMRTFLIALSVLAIFFLGYWVKNLRQENVILESRVERMENQVADKSKQQQNTRRLEAQLTAERQRLDQLRTRLEDTIRNGAQPPTGSVEAHISNLTRRISTLETQLRSLGLETRVIKDNAKTYQQQTQAATLDQQLDLQNRIQAVNQQIAALQQSNAQRVEIEALLLTRNQLQTQIQQLNTATAAENLAAAQVAQAEQSEVQVERQNIENQLADLRADLGYWQSLRQGRSPAAQPARVRELQEQIRAQEARLNEIDQQIRTR